MDSNGGEDPWGVAQPAITMTNKLRGNARNRVLIVRSEPPANASDQTIADAKLRFVDVLPDRHLKGRN